MAGVLVFRRRGRRVRNQILAIAAILVLTAAPAWGQADAPPTEGSSQLTGWSLDGEVVVAGSQSSVTAAQAYRCWAVFDVIDEYNAAGPDGEPDLNGLGPYPDGSWPGWVTPWDISSIELSALILYGFHAESHGLSSTEIDFCGDVHTNGWLPATADLVQWIENDDGTGIVQVTVEGVMTCGQGQVLMVSSTYYYTDFPTNGWQSFAGTDWQENYQGGLTVTGNYAFSCLTIFDDPDPADFVNDIITAQVNLNPTAQGLTGLETWLWYEFPTAATYRIDNAAVVINRYGRDWVLEAHAWVDSIHWDVDCLSACTYRGPLAGFDLGGYEYSIDFPDTVLSPAPLYEAGAGTEGDAAVEHMYEEKGAFQVSTATVWRGYWTFGDQTHMYEPVVVAEGRSYDVVEIRSVLQGEEG